MRTADDQAVALGAQLLEHLRDREDEMVDLLRTLVEAESPSHDPEAQLPIQEMLFYALKERGFRVRKIAGDRTGGHLLAMPPQRRRHAPYQLLAGHCDTVWPIGTLTTMPLRRSNGKLHGPGVYDMKGGLVQMLFALQAIEVLDLVPDVTPVVFINSDEEIGSPESAGHIRRLARSSDRAFILEPSLGNDGRLKTARKGVGRFTITVTGRAAHAGLEPEKGISAILELSHVVQRVFALNDPDRGITVNVGTIEGGIRPNVIAPHSSAVVDVRVLRHEHAVSVEQTLLDLRATSSEAEIALEGGFGRPPMERTPGNGRLFRRAVELGSELGLALDEATAGGGSDGNFTSQFVPTLDGMGPVGGGAHSPDEFVVISSMPRRSALLARLLLEPAMSVG